MPAQPPSRASDAADWRAVLGPLAPPAAATDGTARTPLAIGIDLLTGFGGFGFSRFGASPADIHDLRDGSPLAVALRPMRPGGRSGWVRGGLTWKTFRYAGTSNSGPLAAFEPTHAELLGRLARLFLAEHAFGTDPGEVLRLDEFRGPDGWALLGLARRTGIELVGTGVVGDAVWGAPASMHLALDRAGGSLTVTPLVEVEGTTRTDLRPAGTGGFCAITALPDRPLAAVALHAAADPVPAQISPLLERRDPLLIPEADADEFLTDLAPLLRTSIAVTSRDPSLEIPESTPPRLRLAIVHGPDSALDLEWSWTYRAPRRTLPLDPAPGDRGRDGTHEAAVLAAVRRIWDDAATVASQHLDGAEAAHVVEHALPRLASLPDVDVLEHGDRPEYGELTGTPHLRITQVEPPNAHAHDWLDLSFEITLGEHLVPFTAVFAALSQGKKAVLLPDRTYFRLDHPTFEALRELIAEAETMPEWEPEHPAIPREQIALWEEFEDLADETVEAASWRESIGALRDLGSIDAVPAPAGLRAELRPYQLEGLAWLALLWRHRMGGILADDMGLGKTLQTLALIVHARRERPGDPPFLVVAPSSVLPVWRAEAQRFAPHLDVRVLDATARGRGTPVAEETAGADLVVTSYTVLRHDEDEFTARDWSGLVLDEAQAVKNPAARTHRAAQAVRAPFRLAITGTPLENSLTDLWALLSITAPGLFPSPRAFREEYVRPIETPDASESGTRRAAQRMERLRRRVRLFVLRRAKDSVARDLPPRQEQVVRIPLQAAHRSLYDRVLQRERQKLLRLLEEDMQSHRFIVFRSLTLLRMLALDPAIVDAEHAAIASSKLEAALERLDEAIAEGHRVLVFSQFTSHLRRVAARLAERGIEHAYLDGSTTDRGGVVTRFREGTAPVFLISLKAGGFGLTLTEADYVLLLDPWWNPAAEAQAIDRTHRIGQDRPVMVYRMVAEDTIEEKVLELQARKRELFDALTDGESAFDAALTAEDVRGLLGA